VTNSGATGQTAALHASAIESQSYFRTVLGSQERPHSDEKTDTIFPYQQR
jgi:hypothetical protein